MDVLVNAAPVKPMHPNAKNVVMRFQSFYDVMFHVLFGPITSSFPLAALLSKWYRLEGRYLIASPVRWMATHNDVLLLEEKESVDRTHFEQFSTLMRQEGMETYFHSNSLWLVRVDNKPTINALPVSRVINTSLMSALPSIDVTHYWQKILTECQMLFNTGSTSSEGHLGVWFWGQGALENKSSKLVVAPNESYLQLAHLLSTNVALFNANRHYPNQSVILFNDDKQVAQLNPAFTTHWHWNTMRYTTSHWKTIPYCLRRIFYEN